MHDHHRFEETRDGVDPTEAIKWDLYILIACSSSYLIACILLIFAANLGFPVYTSLFPIILYELGKILFSAIALKQDWGTSRKESTKDIIECGLTVIYYVGIILKLAAPKTDCTYLIVPVTLVLIVRIVLSMGLGEEFDGLYAICRSVFRFFTLLMTISVTLKIEQYIEMTWSQAFWPYWLFFSFLSLMSLGSLIISFQGCCCHNLSEQNHFSMVVSTIWMAYSFLGITISSFSMIYVFVTYEDDLSQAAGTLYIFIMYLFVLIVFTYFAFARIVHFRLIVSKSEEDLLDQPEVHSAQHLRREAESDTNQGTTEQVRRTIPTFLMRVTQTLFKPLDQKTRNKAPLDNFVNKDCSFHGMSCEKGENSGTDLSVSIPAIMHRTEASKQPMIIKRVLSERDSGHSEAKNVPGTEEICLICCEKKADGVLLPCSHGGLCFECARRLGHQNPVCHFCRKNFWQVVKVDLNPDNKTDFFRVIEMASIFQYPQLPNLAQAH